MTVSEVPAGPVLSAALAAGRALDAVRQAAGDLASAREGVRSSEPGLTVARNRAVWELYHQGGLSSRDIEREFAAAGLSLSHDTVERVVGSRARPADRP